MPNKTLTKRIEPCPAESYSIVTRKYMCYVTDKPCDCRTNRLACRPYNEEILTRRKQMQMEAAVA